MSLHTVQIFNGRILYTRQLFLKRDAKDARAHGVRPKSLWSLRCRHSSWGAETRGPIRGRYVTAAMHYSQLKDVVNKAYISNIPPTETMLMVSSNLEGR